MNYLASSLTKLDVLGVNPRINEVKKVNFHVNIKKYSSKSPKQQGPSQKKVPNKKGSQPKMAATKTRPPQKKTKKSRPKKPQPKKINRIKKHL